MDNPEKLATYGTQDTRRKHTNQKHNTLCVRQHYTQTNTNNEIIHGPSYKQLWIKMNRTYGNCNGHHNTELRT